MLLATALVFCFTLAWLASAIGLAPIVGAYAAGLVLEDVHYRGFAGSGKRAAGSGKLEELINPISSFLVPVFFVLMGMRVDLAAFARPEILGLAAVLTLAAVLGKQACALGAVGARLDWLSIGIGMIPRGEVGLIFANIGLTLVVRGEHIVDSATYGSPGCLRSLLRVISTFPGRDQSDHRFAALPIVRANHRAGKDQWLHCRQGLFERDLRRRLIRYMMGGQLSADNAKGRETSTTGSQMCRRH